jgi:hypothetical protein
MASDSPGRLAQIRQMVVLTAQADPRYVPLVVAAALLGGGALFALGLLLAGPILGAIMGLLGMLIAFTSVTARRGQNAALRRIEGQPGAAYAVLESLRGDWRVTPAVAVNRKQDLLHRVVGRAGVVLVAEGSSGRVRDLIGSEARRVRPLIGDAPIHDVTVGDAEGQVPLRKLQAHILKLPRTLRPREVNAIESRLKALGGTAMPLPKGPLPTRMPRGGKQR